MLGHYSPNFYFLSKKIINFTKRTRFKSPSLHPYFSSFLNLSIAIFQTQSFIIFTMKSLKVVLLAILLLPFCLKAQESKKVDIIEYIQELQKWKKEANSMSLTWVLPEEYWGIALRDQQQFSEDLISQFEDVFKGKILVGTINMTIENFGYPRFKSKDEIKESIVLIDKNGDEHYPLDEDLIHEDIQNILELIKPFLSQNMGRLGEGLSFFVFENSLENSQGDIFKSDEEGGFEIRHSGEEFDYLFPLSAMVPPKYCPVDNRKMKGNWNFCPVHGDELIAISN